MPEIELKLTTAPTHLSKLRKLLEEYSRSPAATASLISTYYDSADLKLRQHHITLRVRDQDHHFRQTIKRENGAADGDLLARGEWEDVITGDQPDLEASATGPQLQDIVSRGELQPLFRTDVRRTVIELEPHSGTNIEVAIDEGEIRSAEGGVTEPLSEIELEVKNGDRAVVYDLGLQLLEVAPLRIETLSKAARGYRLVATDQATTSAMHAEPVVLDASMTVETVLQIIGRSCIGHLLKNESAALEDNAEGIHQMRVAAAAPPLHAIRCKAHAFGRRLQLDYGGAKVDCWRVDAGSQLGCFYR